MDAASDINLIVAVEATTRGIQVGTWMGRDIEIVYVSLESLAAHRPTRGTLHGAHKAWYRRGDAGRSEDPGRRRARRGFYVVGRPNSKRELHAEESAVSS